MHLWTAEINLKIRAAFESGCTQQQFAVQLTCNEVTVTVVVL